jgi:hypothetical protein
MYDPISASLVEHSDRRAQKLTFLALDGLGCRSAGYAYSAPALHLPVPAAGP